METNSNTGISNTNKGVRTIIMGISSKISMEINSINSSSNNNSTTNSNNLEDIKVGITKHIMVLVLQMDVVPKGVLEVSIGGIIKN